MLHYICVPDFMLSLFSYGILGSECLCATKIDKAYNLFPDGTYCYYNAIDESNKATHIPISIIDPSSSSFYHPVCHKYLTVWN